MSINSLLKFCFRYPTPKQYDAVISELFTKFPQLSDGPNLTPLQMRVIIKYCTLCYYYSVCLDLTIMQVLSTEFGQRTTPLMQWFYIKRLPPLRNPMGNLKTLKQRHMECLDILAHVTCPQEKRPAQGNIMNITCYDKLVTLVLISTCVYKEKGKRKGKSHKQCNLYTKLPCSIVF